MLYVTYGTDREKTGAYVAKIIGALLKKRPHADVFTVTSDSFSASDIPRFVGGSGLFEDKHIVRLEGLLQNDETRDHVLDYVPQMAESGHIFILREESLTAPLKKTLEKHAKETRLFDVKASKEKKLNVFAMTDALAARDKKKLWMLYREAIQEGLPPEELHGILWWQIKTILQAAEGDAGDMKPFALMKAKNALRHYTKEEAQNLARAFVRMYHESRRGHVDFEVGLEKLLLSV